MTGTRDRFAAVVRSDDVDLGLACALLAAEAEPHHSVAAAVAALDELADRVPDQGDPLPRLLVPLAAFAGDAADYQQLASSLLPDVLARRRGLPILLSVVWLEVARRVGIPAHGVGLPGHFVVGVGDAAGARLLVDPFRHGRLLADADLTTMTRAAGAVLTPESLRAWEPVEILRRVLANIRAWAAHPDRLVTRRWAIELSLLLPRHPLDLRREYGQLLVQLGDYELGARELDAFADVVVAVDVRLADQVRREARWARSRLN